MQDVLEPASFLEALDQPEHKALSTTVDNGGTMGVLRTQEDVAKVIGRTCHYMVFGRTADAFQQWVINTEKQLQLKVIIVKKKYSQILKRCI